MSYENKDIQNNSNNNHFYDRFVNWSYIVKKR